MKFAQLTIIFIFLTGFVPTELTQEDIYPNELKGFEFFGKGKLKDLKLGASKKEDVEIIFGESCKDSCDYDNNFRIKFEYLKPLDDCMTTEEIRDRLMCPQNDFVGTVSSITLEPKQRFVVMNLLSPEFNNITEGSTVEKGSGYSINYKNFTDKYGLGYSIYQEVSGESETQKPAFVGGDLHSIKYGFTENFIRKVFTVEYKTRKKELNN